MNSKSKSNPAQPSGYRTIGRRELLDRLLGAAVAAGLLAPWSLASAHPHVSDGESSAEKLSRDLKRKATRDTSEQSVTMLLALENLAAQNGDAAYEATPFNKDLATRFEHLVDLLLQIKPEPQESDVVALIELLAEQEFYAASPGAMA